MIKIRQYLKKTPTFIKVLLVFTLIFLLGRAYIINQHSASKYFTDKKVISLSNAAKKGNIKKIDKLLDDGVDINTVGKTGLNPLYWLLVMNGESSDKKIGFKHLLEKGADPTQIHTETGWNLIHTTSKYNDSYYLKTILDSGKLNPGDLDIEIENDGWPLALMQASLSDRFENFKLLLDHGASINKWSDSVGRTVLSDVSGNSTWKYAYELLERGADYTVKIKNSRTENSDIVFSINELRYWPSVAISYSGTDYRQKCVEFLENKGVETNPWMPADEKYVKENGEYVLYLYENYNWIEYKKSEKYNQKEKEKNSLKGKINNWIYERFYN